MAIDVKAETAKKRQLKPAGTWGNLTNVKGTIEMAAQAQNKQAAMVMVPANSRIRGVKYNADALGANTVITIGYEAVDGSPASAAYFGTMSDTSSASAGNSSAFDLLVTEDTYITAKQTGSGTATGTVEVSVDYVYNGGV